MALTPIISTAPQRLLLEPDAWERVLVVAPHPDDESLATANLLDRARAHGAAVRVVFCTDGESNPWPQRALERRWTIDAAARRRWAARRRDEARAALECLGLPPRCALFLHAPDQGLTRVLLAGGQEFLARLTVALETWRPTMVAAPSLRDRHPDHSAAGVLVRLAVSRLPAAARWFTELAYVVHGPTPAPPALSLPLTSAGLARKRAAILCHATQLALSRRRMLSHAVHTERFLAPGTARVRHPVRCVAMDDDALVVGLDGEGLLGGRLYVVGQTAAGRVVVRSSTVRPRQRDARFRVPAPLVRVFVKRETSRLFFDGSGWRELWLPRAGTPTDDGRRRAPAGVAAPYEISPSRISPPPRPGTRAAPR